METIDSSENAHVDLSLICSKERPQGDRSDVERGATIHTRFTEHQAAALGFI